jgi:hypothetical protein
MREARRAGICPASKGDGPEEQHHRRAFALVQEKSKAVTAYRDSFNLWKGADSDVPVLKRAKAEFVRL